MSLDSRAARAEINRLTRLISEEEQTVNGLFQRIGQTYFAAHKDEPEETQAGYIRAIYDAFDRTKQYKEQINRVRGIAICPSCGAEVTITSAFCNRCGTRMPNAPVPFGAPDPTAVICPACGNRCAQGQRFCNRCGGMLAAPQNPAPAPQNPIPASQMPPQNPIPAPQPVTFVPEPEPAPEPQSEPVPIPEPEPAYVPAPQSEPVYAPEPESAPAPQEPAARAGKICPNCGTELAEDSAFCLECGQPV